MHTIQAPLNTIQHAVNQDCEFSYEIERVPFDENYHPAEDTRITTNFANLARGDCREENVRKALMMIDSRFNALACWDNPQRDRYKLELKIISVTIKLGQLGKSFPSIEILQSDIIDLKSKQRIEGIVGNNFSSYVRDYDFSVRLPEHNRGKAAFSIPDDFGELHGKLFQDFLHSNAYRQNFTKLPVICLSVSNNKTYLRTANQHPVLGQEYEPNEASLTEQYFKEMGLQVRYFMPANAVAPLAFYFFGDLSNDYTNLELIGAISIMETFQKIYRPEIYNANARAGSHYQPQLKHTDHSLTLIDYDREERSQLAVNQGKFAETHFIQPHRTLLAHWAQSHGLNHTKQTSV